MNPSTNPNVYPSMSEEKLDSTPQFNIRNSPTQNLDESCQIISIETTHANPAKETLSKGISMTTKSEKGLIDKYYQLQSHNHILQKQNKWLGGQNEKLSYHVRQCEENMQRWKRQCVDNLESINQYKNVLSQYQKTILSKDKQLETLHLDFETCKRRLSTTEDKLNTSAQQLLQLGSKYQQLNSRYQQLLQLSLTKTRRYQQDLAKFLHGYSKLEQQFTSHKVKLGQVLRLYKGEREKNDLVDKCNQSLRSLKGLIQRCTVLKNSLQSLKIMLPPSLSQFNANQLDQISKEQKRYTELEDKRTQELKLYRAAINGFSVNLSYLTSQFQKSLIMGKETDFRSRVSEIVDICSYLVIVTSP